MDTVDSQPLLIQNIYPNTGQTEIGEREEEVNPGKNGPTGGEIIAAVGFAVEVVHGGSDGHGDLEVGEAVGEDEGVLVGVVVEVEGVEAVGVVSEGVEGVDGLEEVGSEGAGDLAVLDLLEDVEPGVAGAEEEAEPGEVEVGVGVGEGDFGDVEFEAAAVGETELVQGDDGAVVRADVGETDLGQGERECEGEGDEDERGRERHGWSDLGSGERERDVNYISFLFWKLE